MHKIDFTSIRAVLIRPIEIRNAEYDAVSQLKTDLAEKTSGHQAILAGSGNPGDLPDITAALELLPIRIERARKALAEAEAALRVAAVRAVDSLSDWFDQEDAAARSAAVAALQPFCADAFEAQALAERCSKVRAANHAKDDLLHDLDSLDFHGAVNRLMAILDKSLAAESPDLATGEPCSAEEELEPLATA